MVVERSTEEMVNFIACNVSHMEVYAALTLLCVMHNIAKRSKCSGFTGMSTHLKTTPFPKPWRHLLIIVLQSPIHRNILFFNMIEKWIATRNTRRLLHQSTKLRAIIHQALNHKSRECQLAHEAMRATNLVHSTTSGDCSIDGNTSRVSNVEDITGQGRALRCLLIAENML